ncbi:MAG: radical SAM protein [Elusimicrobiota bacterium]
MITPIDSVGIILSYKCQSGCKHCLYACGPAWNDWMDIKTLRSILAGIKSIWQDYHPNPLKNVLFHGIHLAGGEPFLNFPLLLEAVKETINSNIYLGYVETNAGWWQYENEISAKFSELRKVGLKRILISCSPFHAENIPLKRTLYAIENAYNIFGKDGVIIYMEHCVFEIATFGTDDTVPIEKWIEKYGKEETGRIFWQGYGLIPGGKSGYYLGDLTKKYSAERFADETCEFEILKSQHAHFDLYGNYIPYFCGGLSIGDARDLVKFYENFNLDNLPLTKILVENGPYDLMRFAKEKYGYAELPDGYVGKCHLCVDVRKHIALNTDEFRELSPKQFYLLL